MHYIEGLVWAIEFSDCWTIEVVELQCRGQTHSHWVSLPWTPYLQQQKISGGSHMKQT